MTSSDGNEKMPTRTVKRTPRRGQILDANYTPLVTSVSFYDIHMDPVVIKQELFDREISNFCAELSDLYPNKSAHEYEVYIRKARVIVHATYSFKKMVTNDERKKLREMPIFNKGD